LGGYGQKGRWNVLKGHYVTDLDFQGNFYNQSYTEARYYDKEGQKHV